MHIVLSIDLGSTFTVAELSIVNKTPDRGLRMTGNPIAKYLT